MGTQGTSTGAWLELRSDPTGFPASLPTPGPLSVSISHFCMSSLCFFPPTTVGLSLCGRQLESHHFSCDPRSNKASLFQIWGDNTREGPSPIWAVIPALGLSVGQEGTRVGRAAGLPGWGKTPFLAAKLWTCPIEAGALQRAGEAKTLQHLPDLPKPVAAAARGQK